MPLSRDKVDAPRYVAEFAIVYATLGEKDLALKQLAIVSTIPGGPTYGELKLSSDWDPLRGDQRFEAMVALLAPKETLK